MHIGIAWGGWHSFTSIRFSRKKKRNGGEMKSVSDEFETIVNRRVNGAGLVGHFRYARGQTCAAEKEPIRREER